MSRTLCNTAFVLFLLSTTGAHPQRLYVDDAGMELIVAAVEVAAEYDLYNARCRGDLSGRRTDNLNKILLGKYGITVLQVQDNYFPEPSYRAARERIEQGFLERLSTLGGCQAAKAAGMQRQISEQYNALTRQLQQLP